MNTLEFRPNPNGKRNFVIEAAAAKLFDSAQILSRLGVEIGARAVLDDADVAAIEARINGAKAEIAKVEAELAAPASKVRQASPVHDGAFVDGGLGS